MHKKKESSLFKSLKNQNAFKKKGNKLLKSLTSLPTHSLHSPLCHMHGDNLMKNQLKIERTRMISSEYALNYKESNYPNCKKKPLGEYKSHKESIKSAKILLNSAFDACSQGKSTKMTTMGETKRSNRNLSASDSEYLNKQSNQQTDQQNGRPLFQSYRKNRYTLFGKSRSSSNLLCQNIKKLEITKNQNQKLLSSVIRKIKLEQDRLEQERQKFLMMKNLYQNQIKKLTKEASNKGPKGYKLPISNKETKSIIKFNEESMNIYYCKQQRVKSRKETQTQ